jgi:hypothetical protein
VCKTGDYGQTVICHPNATYGIRSSPEQGKTAQAQAMYDARGKLITDGISAGTSDRVGPDVDLTKHMRIDYRPFKWVQDLDAHFGRTYYRQLYRKVRPSKTGDAPTNVVN